MCGTPSILIRAGEVQQKAMQENRYTLDELLEELRGQGYTSISEVKYAVLENSGQLSVLPWVKNQPPTAEQLQLDLADNVTLPTVLINDGRLLKKNLSLCGKDPDWLYETLKSYHLTSPRQVFLLTVDEQDETFCIKKESDP